MIRFANAREVDAEALAAASARAFENDIHHGAPSAGGPPGYRSAPWQARMMRLGRYFKVLAGRRIIGGMIVFAQGPGHYELGRIFIEPEFQNQGIGTQALGFLWRAFPFARRWTLGTPAWNARNHHFYEKQGFVRVGEEGPPGRPHGYLYERRLAPRVTGWTG